MDSVYANAPYLGPVFAALLAGVFLNLTANSLKGPERLALQYLLFSFAGIASLSYLISSDSKLLKIWEIFIGLSFEERFSLSLFLISIIIIVVFGSTNLSEDEALNAIEVVKSVTPACIDTSVSFEIPSDLPDDDKVLFEYSFEKFVKEIIADLPTLYELSPEAVAWTERQIRFNGFGGKMNRGLSVLSVHREFVSFNGQQLTNKGRIQAAALGWCIEFLQAFFLVADDVMDGSITRRGQPCWYKLPEVQLVAINDSFILESVVYKILKRYFGSEPYYLQLIELFIEVTRQTEFGQLLDLTSQPLGGPIDLSRFTIERYTSIVKYKTAFYSFYLPVALGMIVSGVKDKILYDKAREILLIMGEYFQVQDDYLDCYGSPEVIGKIGTDIQDNKCSWLVVQALKISNQKQLKILEENYGQHDPKKVAKIKKLYLDLNIEKIYLDYEESSYKKIIGLMEEVKSLPTEIFGFLLKKIYKRSK